MAEQIDTDQVLNNLSKLQLEGTFDLLGLPEEIQLELCKFLPDRDLAHLSQCSRRLANFTADTREHRQLAEQWGILNVETLLNAGDRYMPAIDAFQAMEDDPRIAKHVRKLIFTPQCDYVWGIVPPDLVARGRNRETNAIENRLASLVNAGVITAEEQDGMLGQTFNQDGMLGQTFNQDGWLWMIMLSMLQNLTTLVIFPAPTMSQWAVKKVVEYASNKARDDPAGAHCLATPTRLEIGPKPPFARWMGPSTTALHLSTLLLLPSVVEVEVYSMFYDARTRADEYFLWPRWSGQNETGPQEENQVKMVSSIKSIKWTDCYVTPRDLAELLRCAPELKTLEVSGFNPLQPIMFVYDEHDSDDQLKTVSFSSPEMYRRHLAHSFKIRTGGRFGRPLPEDLEVILQDWQLAQQDNGLMFQ